MKSWFDRSAANGKTSRNSWSQRIVDWLFGYDFFISYRWEDGRDYAKRLHEILKKDYTCFLDSSEYAAADDIVSIGRRALKETSRLLFVGSPRAAHSKHIKRELAVYRSSDRGVLAISFGDSISQLRSADPEFAELLPPDELHLTESPRALREGPSDHVVYAVVKSLATELKRMRRKQAVATVACTITMLTLAAVVMVWMIVDYSRSKRAQLELLNVLAAEVEGLDTEEFKVTIDGTASEAGRKQVDANWLVYCCNQLGVLRELRLSNCDLTNVEALAKLRSLEHLNLFSSRGIGSLAFLEGLPHLEQVLLHNTGLADDHLSGVTLPRGIVELKLTKNKITSAGFDTLLLQLTDLQRLERLNLYGCERLIVSKEHIEMLSLLAEQLTGTRRTLVIDVGKSDSSNHLDDPDVVMRIHELQEDGVVVEGISTSPAREED